MRRHRQLLQLLFLFLIVSTVAFFPAAMAPTSLARLDSIPPALHRYPAGVWSHFKALLGATVGNTHPAIAHLKSYFAQFGYLNLSSASNAGTLFDSATLSALHLYQQSFNLSLSGELDMPTLLKIMTPRCGREDVAGGVPLMLQQTPSPPQSSAPVLDDAEGKQGHYSFFPSNPSWPPSRRNLTYAFNSINETQRLSAAQRRQAFANAFSEWAAVVPLNFTEVDDYGAADIRIEFVSFEHGDEEPFDGVLGILAHAFSPTDGRFHLDDSEFWFSASTGGGGSMVEEEIDLQSVATHEIGHLIGLAHTAAENAIMYPSLGPGQVKLQLQADDIQGAQALYGVNPSFDPSSPLPGIPSTIMQRGKSVDAFSRASVSCTPRELFLALTPFFLHFLVL